MLDRLKQRIKDLETAPQRAAQLAAPRIQAQFRIDATTRRGNVPGYGKMGNPIIASATDTEVKIDAPDWVMGKARKQGHLLKFGKILGEALHEIVSK